MMRHQRHKIFSGRNAAAAALSLLLAACLLAVIIPSSIHAQSLTGAAAPAVYAGAPEPSVAAAAVSAYGGQEIRKQTAPAVPALAATLTLSVIPDVIAPSFTGVTPLNGALTGPAISAVAYFQDAEPSSGISAGTAMIHIDGRHQSGCTVTGSSITCDKSGLSDGFHSLEAFVCDTNINCGSVTWAITTDASPPAISGLGPSGTINTHEASLVAQFGDGTGSGIDPDSASVVIDGVQTSATCQITGSGAACPLTGLVEGQHLAQLEISDRVGNRSVVEWSFVVDSGAIGITGQKPAHGSWQRTSAPEIGAAFQAAGMGTVDAGSAIVLLDGAVASSLFDCRPDGIDSLPSLTPLAEGWHTLSVSISDDLGHEGLAQWGFGVDTLSPVITGLQPLAAAGRLAVISAGFQDGGSGIDAGSARLLIDGADETGSATISTGGITYAPSHPFAAGPHQAQVTIEDVAGNPRTSAWSFQVAADPLPASVPATTTTDSQPLLRTGYWTGINPLLARTGGGGWMITGLNAFSRQYHLPWFGSAAGTETAGQRDELRITNIGAGEADVVVLIGGREEWRATIPEGAGQSWNAPASGSGPLKVVSGNGQKLEVIRRVAADGLINDTKALPAEELEPVLLLPWHEAVPPGEGRAELVLANPGPSPAEAEVYLGDPELPESLLGRFTLQADTAVRTDLPAASGGPVRIVSMTARQPLTASLERTVNGSHSQTLATGFSRLQDRYLFSKGAASFPDGAARLQMGNGNDRDIRVEVRQGGITLRDPDSGEESWIIKQQGARTVSLGGIAADMEAICLDCGPGEGFAAGLSS